MTRPLDTDEVAAIYDDLVDTYQLEWARRGHRSLHLSYYDENHQDPGEAAINTMRLLSDAAEIDSADRVLNIGCGAGEDSVWNARAHGATVVGVDIGERQLELARENAREHGVAEQVSFRQDDFQVLDTVDDSSVDVVWALEALSHSPDRAQALEQANRVLDADGRIAVADIFLRQPTDDERVTEVEDALGLRLGSIDEFERTLRDTGFENIQMDDETDGIRECLQRRNKFARLAHPIGSALRKLRINRFSKRQLEGFRGSRLMHDLVADDVIGYYVVTADRSEAGAE